MTRGQIIADALEEAHALDSGAPGFSNPILLNRWVDEGVEEICLTSDMVYVQYTDDIVANVSQYCYPPIRMLEGVTLVGSDGTTVRDLKIMDTQEMQAYIYNWRSAPAPAGDPVFLITDAQSGVELYPCPNYSHSAGITYSGIGLVDKTLWATNASSCPLPSQTHAAVKYYVALKIAWFNQSKSAQYLEKQWMRRRTLAQSDVGAITRAKRHRFPPMGGFIPQPYGNPLNL